METPRKEDGAEEKNQKKKNIIKRSVGGSVEKCEKLHNMR